MDEDLTAYLSIHPRPFLSSVFDFSIISLINAIYRAKLYTYATRAIG